MSNISLTLDFEELKQASEHNFDLFQNVKIDVQGTTYTLPTYLFLTSFALSAAEGNYAAIADSFSSALNALGISMDNRGTITLDLSSFTHYVKTISGMSADDIDRFVFA